MSVAVVVGLTTSLPGHLSLLLLAAEAAFGLVVAPLRHRHLSRGNSSGGSRDVDPDGDGSAWLRSGMAALQALLDPSEAHAELVRAEGGKWLSGHWSHQANELGHRNIADFLSYSIFARRDPAVASTSVSASASPSASGGSFCLKKAASQFIHALGLDIPEDSHNPDAAFIAHTEAPLVSAYRPLTFYLLTEAIAAWSHLKLTKQQVWMKRVTELAQQ